MAGEWTVVHARDQRAMPRSGPNPLLILLPTTALTRRSCHPRCAAPRRVPRSPCQAGRTTRDGKILVNQDLVLWRALRRRDSRGAAGVPHDLRAIRLADTGYRITGGVAGPRARGRYSRPDPG